MNDENSEHEHQHPHVHAISYTEYVNQYKMIGQQNAHAILSAIESMDKEQLEAMKGLLGMVLKNTHTNGYFQGVVSQVLQKKFNICPGCGVNHDEVPADWSEQKDADTAEPKKITDPSEKAVLMDEYGVHADPDNPGQVICDGCGFVSASIEDRMLRPPLVKGCEGCQHKAKWG